MMTIILRGKLGEKFGREWNLGVRSPAQALCAIDTLKGGFFTYIYELENEMQGYHVQVDDKTIPAEMLPFGFMEGTVTITPVLQGADTKGLIEIVAGVALVALAIAAPAIGAPALGIAAGAGVWTIGGVTAGLLIAGLGVSLALAGVARLLTSAPPGTGGSNSKTLSSYVFSGVVNTVQQGECVPVAYGSPIVGSAVVSVGVETNDVTN